MKLSLGLTAVLAGCAIAAQQAAQVYILPTAPETTASTTTPSISRTLARLILLQRVAPASNGPSIYEIPDGADPEGVVSLMNKYGKEPVSLFSQAELDDAPSQLVVLLEGLTPEQMKDFETAFKSKPAFTISDPPSASAHEKLLYNDFFNVGITNEHKCSIKDVINPFEEQCWSGKSTVAKYNVQKNPDALTELSRLASGLMRLAVSGEMETTVVLLPSSGGSSAQRWSDRPEELRRRQAEQVISAIDKPAESDAPVSSAPAGEMFYAPRNGVPACFSSEDSCVTGTGNCSGHGSCGDKYANKDGSSGKASCYVCRCLSTVEESGSLTHWAGSTCAKKDVSVPFWLFFGFTIVMLGVLSLSITMLFSVGEEKLPGVIGAGVSRSK